MQPAANRSVWAHTTNIQASGHCVCVSHLVIVLHPNRAGWRKVPFLEASDCCSCLLVARLPGIDKAAPTSTHFLTSTFFFFTALRFSRKNKTARGATAVAYGGKHWPLIRNQLKTHNSNDLNLLKYTFEWTLECAETTSIHQTTQGIVLTLICDLL